MDKPKKLVLDYSKWRNIAENNSIRVRATKKDIEKFFNGLSASENGCIEWVNGKNKDGYGYIYINPRSMRVHRLSYILLVSKIPKGKIICHSCDNRACVNPIHLFAGTKAENNADRKKKGRNRNQNGEKNNQSKLSKEDVLYILSSDKSPSELAPLFGISKSNMEAIKRRALWKHITNAEIDNFKRNRTRSN